MPIAAKTVAAPSGMGVLLDHSDVQAVLGQVSCGGDTTHASADNKDGGLAHIFI
jgi:hypothetical protein